jgi:tRNA G18 (ribose-2'-O)-methylase SpoU
MSQEAVEMAGDEQPQGGVFYRCDDAEHCGLRFPVTPTDAFHWRCPRCGGTVHTVARVEIGGIGSVRPVYPASKLHLLLDNWRSLFNVGAAFRTADGAGARHLYLCGITATPDTQRKLAKTALGAERAVQWSYHPDAVQLAATLRSEGSQLWVLERTDHARPLFDISRLSVDSSVVLAAGNEVIGVDPGLVAMADQVIQLPMLGSKQSLNVAVALSIATYWLRAREFATLEN